ncbi:MAG: tRNA (adenosine(37)-N6)-dimethylallyltransferase MiaA [Pseudomonadota bacterium]
MNELPPAVVISGPTAAGKTEVAIELAQLHPVDLISVDSAQVYRGMNVGTAKPDPNTLAQYPHALIDIREPEQPYSAADFVRDASDKMLQSYNNGRIPLLVGGTTLYINALRYGLDELPPADASVRAELEARARQIGWPAMHRELAEIDPLIGATIRPNDPQRIGRALEIHRLTGKRPSELMSGRGPDRMCASLFIVITAADRAVLHQRIDARWQQMIEHGLVREVEQLMARPGMSADSSVLRAVGYRQAIDYLNGEIGQDEFIRTGAAATRQLAKRQLTTLRQFRGALWYDPFVTDKMQQNPIDCTELVQDRWQQEVCLGVHLPAGSV